MPSMYEIWPEGKIMPQSLYRNLILMTKVLQVKKIPRKFYRTKKKNKLFEKYKNNNENKIINKI